MVFPLGRPVKSIFPANDRPNRLEREFGLVSDLPDRLARPA